MESKNLNRLIKYQQMLNKMTVVPKQEIYKNQLASLECPFTWKMDVIDDKSINKQYYNDVDIDQSIDKECYKCTDISLPLQKLLRAIMKVYLNVKDDKKDGDAILNNLKKCDDYFDTFMNRADPEISTNVVYAVLQATKCFVYFELNMQELELLLKKLRNIDNMNDKEKSTLLGCKSICWSNYYRNGPCVAEQFIREAIKLNENCGLWHYNLGKNLRRQRRALSIAEKPGHEEAASFLKAYELSKFPHFGVCVAQMYRDRKDYDKASAIYEDIFTKSFDSLSAIVFLRLALGFMNPKQLDKAKKCLDEAEKSCPKRSMYLHYRAKYFMKKGNFEEASHFFEEAIKDGNLAADLEYFQCKLKAQKPFNVTEYLVNMLDRYHEKLPEKQLQSIILHIAYSYWNREGDLKEAIKYFLRAIEIDPQAKCLTNFYSNDVYHIKDKNVYLFLKEYVRPVVQNQRHELDEATVERVKAIQEFCKLNNEACMNTLKHALTSMKMNN